MNCRIIDKNPFKGVSYSQGPNGRDWTQQEFRLAEAWKRIEALEAENAKLKEESQRH